MTKQNLKPLKDEAARVTRKSRYLQPIKFLEFFKRPIFNVSYFVVIQVPVLRGNKKSTLHPVLKPNVWIFTDFSSISHFCCLRKKIPITLTDKLHQQCREIKSSGCDQSCSLQDHWNEEKYSISETSLFQLLLTGIK